MVYDYLYTGRLAVFEGLVLTDLLQQIVHYLQADKAVEVVWLYGSQANGTATKDSDYDLAVAFAAPFLKGMQQRLRPESLAAEITDAFGLEPEKVSILDINIAPLPLAMSVVQKGKVILSKNTLREAKEENRITSMWELDHEYHRRQFG